MALLPALRRRADASRIAGRVPALRVRPLGQPAAGSRSARRRRRGSSASRAARVRARLGMWDTIGGFLEEDEDALAALHREVYEETGLEVAVGEFVGAFSDRYGDGEDAPTVLNLVFEARMVTGDPQPADDVTELAWFAPHALPADDELAFDWIAPALRRWPERRSVTTTRSRSDRLQGFVRAGSALADAACAKTEGRRTGPSVRGGGGGSLERNLPHKHAADSFLSAYASEGKSRGRSTRRSPATSRASTSAERRLRRRQARRP